MRHRANVTCSRSWLCGHWRLTQSPVRWRWSASLGRSIVWNTFQPVCENKTGRLWKRNQSGSFEWSSRENNTTHKASSGPPKSGNWILYSFFVAQRPESESDSRAMIWPSLAVFDGIFWAGEETEGDDYRLRGASETASGVQCCGKLATTNPPKLYEKLWEFLKRNPESCCFTFLVYTTIKSIYIQLFRVNEYFLEKITPTFVVFYGNIWRYT